MNEDNTLKKINNDNTNTIQTYMKNPQPVFQEIKNYSL